MTLSPRLKKTVDFAGKCGVVADIGTDHALVPVYLIENGLYRKAYACDIRPFPLKRAEEYISSRNLSDKITAILSDGLKNVPADVDTVIIAGMGGEMIIDILSSDIAHSGSLFVLQPMTSINDLRLFLYSNGYSILDEEIVSEHRDKKLYSVMKVKRTGEKAVFSELDVLLSPALQLKKTCEKDLYIIKNISSRLEIIENLKKSNFPDLEYMKKTESEIKLLERCLNAE
ncbi:MAG: SAM-dependent methyltransferase [Clostridia bacterium]|nr:SAM-dependent methyltransferase [Clostridia bacterium]